MGRSILKRFKSNELSSAASQDSRFDPLVLKALSHQQPHMLPHYDFDGLDGYDEEGHFDWVTISQLPYLTRPITEFVHDVKPDVVAAADRGGRFVGLAVHNSWQYLYPNERFPTLDGKVHFGRWSRDIEYPLFKSLTGFVMERAGGKRQLQQLKVAEGVRQKLRVMLIDDWICDGTNIKRFKRSLKDNGYVRSNTEFFAGTMVGPSKGVVNVIGDPQRDPRNAEWNNDAGIVGVDYGWDEVHPHKVPPFTASEALARRTIYDGIKKYYSSAYRGHVPAAETADLV